MPSSFFEFLFWVIIGYILGWLLIGISYIGKPKKENMEARILLAIEKSNSELRGLIAASNSELKDSILKSEIRLNDRMGNQSTKLSD